MNSNINVCHWLGKLGQRAEAEPLLRDGLAQLRVNAGIGHRLTLNTITQLALFLGACQAKDAVPEALTLLREALKEREASLGPEHPDTVASAQRLAALLEAMGQEEKAKRL